jgi:predicted MFS family arabinose efflux permease
MGLISGSVQAGFLISSALAGFRTLRLGAINLTLFSIIVCALSLGGLIDANSVLVLGGILSVLGACASLTWVPMVEVSRDIIAPKNRGKAMGLMFSGTSYGIYQRRATGHSVAYLRLARTLGGDGRFCCPGFPQ